MSWRKKKQEKLYPPPTDGQMLAKEHLSEVRADEVTVATVIEKLQRLRTENHFGDSVADTFRVRGDKK
jgi:hypothetical protein